MGVKCPRCQYENPDDTLYCGRCATSLENSEKVSISETKTMVSSIADGSTIAGKYRIVKKLGEGGMEVVYKAEDIRLDRTVALKFLSSELSQDSKSRDRFIQEAKAASGLDHPNICTIHEIGETEDERMFIAMSYYEGQTLREKIGSEGLELEEILDITRQMAQGLARAHGKGIIHRDIKPANAILTSDGLVKIVDFGLAKLTGAIRITKRGTRMGTAAYMSPEQAQGEEVDQRTDIWSLGVLLYEMLTGQLPFKGENERFMLYSIMNKDPEPVSNLMSGIPGELEQIVVKALQKDPEDRYQSFDDFLIDLKEVYKRLDIKPEWRLSFRARLGKRKWIASPVLWVSVLVFIGALAGYFLFYPANTIPFQERDWILITDFKNLTDDKVFDQSLNTALTVNLQQSRYVNVFPRTRLPETFKRMGRENIDRLDEALGREVAQREGIKALVSCSIDRVGEVYTLTASIIDPNTQAALRTESSQAKGREKVLVALDNLAKKIRKDLGESLKDIKGQGVDLPKATTSSLEALKYYVEGCQARGKDAAALLQKAIELDPDFALAHARLGSNFYWEGNNPVKGEEHFKKALSLSDRLTERENLWIQAEAARWRGNRDDAAIKYKLYLTKYPDDSEGWHNLGHNYLMLGQYDQAIDAFNKTIEINPGGASAYINLATCYTLTGKDQQAIDNYLKAFELRPEYLMTGNVNREFGFTYVELGEIHKAQEAFEKMLSGDDGQKARGNRHLALLHMYQGKFSSAIDHLKESILLHKTLNYNLSELRDRLFLATVYRLTGEMEAFYGELKAVEEICSGIHITPEWLIFIGKIYIKAGRIQDAERMLEEISAKMDEKNRADRARFNIMKGEIELTRGNYEEAIELLEMAYNLLGSNYTLESVAYGYFMSGDLEKAISKYELLISKKILGGEDQEYWILAHYQLGKIYEEIGDKTKAAQYYEDFLNIWKDADTDIPILIDAEKRLASLKGQ